MIHTTDGSAHGWHGRSGRPVRGKRLCIRIRRCRAQTSDLRERLICPPDSSLHAQTPQSNPSLLQPRPAAL